MRQKKTLSDEKQKYLKSVIKKRNNMTWLVNVGSGLKLTSFGQNGTLIKFNLFIRDISIIYILLHPTCL